MRLPEIVAMTQKREAAHKGEMWVSTRSRLLDHGLCCLIYNPLGFQSVVQSNSHNNTPTTLATLATLATESGRNT